MCCVLVCIRERDRRRESEREEGGREKKCVFLRTCEKEREGRRKRDRKRKREGEREGEREPFLFVCMCV